MIFGDGFEQSTILRTGPEGLTRVITRSSWDRREPVLAEAYEAEFVVLQRSAEVPREDARLRTIMGLARELATELTQSSRGCFRKAAKRNPTGLRLPRTQAALASCRCFHNAHGYQPIVKAIQSRLVRRFLLLRAGLRHLVELPPAKKLAERSSNNRPLLASRAQQKIQPHGPSARSSRAARSISHHMLRYHNQLFCTRGKRPATKNVRLAQRAIYAMRFAPSWDSYAC